MLIYDKTTKRVLTVFDELQTIEVYFQNYPQEFRDNLGLFKTDDIPINYSDYKIINGKLIESPEEVEIITNPLEDRIRELEETIDIMLGGIEDGI